jgi:hypothetical protein
LRLSTSGHLALKHPGYTLSNASGNRFYGAASAVAEIPYDDGFNAAVMGHIVTRINSSIAAMASSGSPSSAAINGGHCYSGGQYYTVWANACSIGTIKSIASNSGAPFGNPLCDLVVTVTASNTGASGIGLVTIGTADTAPSTSVDPKGWSGVTISSSQTLSDFAFKSYIWIACWFSSPSSVTATSVARSCSASISMSNVRYHV